MAPAQETKDTNAITGGHKPQRVWLITGTTSGFGLRLVQTVLARGDRVIAGYRSYEKAQSVLPIGNPNLLPVLLDLTASAETLLTAVQGAANHVWPTVGSESVGANATIANGGTSTHTASEGYHGQPGGIDVLVNNAGIGIPTMVEEGGSSVLRKQFQTNVFGFLDVMTATLPFLRASLAQGRPAALVTIGSRSVYKSELPGLAMYAASKAAARTLTETISAEIPNLPILIVEPGSFRTEGIYGQPWGGVLPFGSKAIPTSSTHPDLLIPEYDALRTMAQKRFLSIPGTERGDPQKAVKLIVDVVRGEGQAEGRPWPRYLVLGEDAYADARRKMAVIEGCMQEWEDVASSALYFS